MDGLSRFKSNRRKSIKKKIIRISLIVVIAFAVSAAILVPFFTKQADTERIYREVMTLIENDNYAEAYEKIRSIEGSDYKDTTSLLYLCNSHILYDEGDVAAAYKEISKVNFYNQTEEQMTKIEEYRDALKNEYDIYKDDQEIVEDEDKESDVTDENTSGNDRKATVKTAEEEFSYEETESFEAEEYSGKNEKENKNENN